MTFDESFTGVEFFQTLLGSGLAKTAEIYCSNPKKDRLFESYLNI